MIQNLLSPWTGIGPVAQASGGILYAGLEARLTDVNVLAGSLSGLVRVALGNGLQDRMIGALGLRILFVF